MNQAEKMKRLGIFSNIDNEAGLIIVASVNENRIGELLKPGPGCLAKVDHKDRVETERRMQ